MLRLALLFLIVALVAGALGLFGVANISAEIAWLLFVVFIILFLVALDMIRARRETQEEPGEVHEGTVKADITITPLATPMLAGPAALSTVITLMSRASHLWQAAIVYAAN